MSALLQVEDLAVCFSGEVRALRGVSFSLERGASLAVLGESGSGKSTLAQSLVGLIQPPEATGSVRLDGQELMGASDQTLRSIRWARAALALQGAPFNPVVSVGDQITEPIRERHRRSGADADRRAVELAEEVLFDPALLERFPHELSGGERRRAMLAMVLALDPELVILDEPTAGLDPATSAELVERIARLHRERGFALVVISHDLPHASKLAQRTIVLYAGEAMEVGATSRVLGEPAHPYSWALVNAYPVMTTTKDLRPIRGLPPDPRAVPPGCPYHPRCTQAEEMCWQSHPGLVAARGRLLTCHFGGLKTLLAAVDVHKTFRSGRREVSALRGVSMTLREGESVGIVGPSGSGKSTLARILTGHLTPDSGQVLLRGAPLPMSRPRHAREARRHIQLVMQDPWDALSPRLTVRELVAEPLELAGTGKNDRERLVGQALEGVGLPSSGTFLQSRTHELSGGQLQRIALARALVTRPKLLVADEPTAMLDASEQARLMVVLRERQIEMGLGLVLISHDIAVVRKVTDRMVVLDQGLVVEDGPSHTISSSPSSATTRQLVETAPTFAFDGVPEERDDLAGERRP